MKSYYIKGNSAMFESAIERYAGQGFSRGEDMGSPILTSPDEKIGIKFANTGFITVQYLGQDYMPQDEKDHIKTVLRLFALAGGESINAGDTGQDISDSLMDRLHELALNRTDGRSR